MRSLIVMLFVLMLVSCAPADEVSDPPVDDPIVERMSVEPTDNPYRFAVECPGETPVFLEIEEYMANWKADDGTLGVFRFDDLIRMDENRFELVLSRPDEYRLTCVSGSGSESKNVTVTEVEGRLAGVDLSVPQFHGSETYSVKCGPEPGGVDGRYTLLRNSEVAYEDSRRVWESMDLDPGDELTCIAETSLDRFERTVVVPSDVPADASVMIERRHGIVTCELSFEQGIPTQWEYLYGSGSDRGGGTAPTTLIVFDTRDASLPLPVECSTRYAGVRLEANRTFG